MRYCNDKCSILPLVTKGDDCPIIHFTKTRKRSDWYFVKDGVNLIPLCEEKHSKMTKKRGRMRI